MWAVRFVNPRRNTREKHSMVRAMSMLSDSLAARLSTTPSRTFLPLEGEPIQLALLEGEVVETRGTELLAQTAFPSRPFAFVGYANRVRRLLEEGFVEKELVPSATLPTLADAAEILTYASSCDVTRSQVQQEAAIGFALARPRIERSALWKELAATFLCIDWPHVFDIEPLIHAGRRTEAPWLAVVTLALAQEPRRYPKELIRLASTLGNAKVVRACLAALHHVEDEDAWMDVLIEGEPVMERVDVKLLRDLSEKAPSKQVAKLARQIAADLRV